MHNLAGIPSHISDVLVEFELSSAGIPVFAGSELQSKSEVETHLNGAIVSSTGHSAHFRRNWYYWVVKLSDALPEEVAAKLNEQWRDTMRVDGHAGGKDVERPVSHYNVDTPAALAALADAIKQHFGTTVWAASFTASEGALLHAVKPRSSKEQVDSGVNALVALAEHYPEQHREGVLKDALAIARKGAERELFGIKPDQNIILIDEISFIDQDALEATLKILEGGTVFSAETQESVFGRQKNPVELALTKLADYHKNATRDAKRLGGLQRDEESQLFQVMTIDRHQRRRALYLHELGKHKEARSCLRDSEDIVEIMVDGISRYCAKPHDDSYREAFWAFMLGRYLLRAKQRGKALIWFGHARRLAKKSEYAALARWIRRWH